MQIKIKSQNLNLSDSQKEMINAKVGKLSHLADRLGDESTEIRVEVRHEKSRKPSDAYICQLTIFAPQAVIRCETRDESVENALDSSIDKIKTQIDRYKAKMHRLDRKVVRLKGVELPKEEGFEIPKILKRKRFSKTDPMSEEAAIERMELVGHDFFLFNNADTGRFAVVYKRRDGFYGIVEPKMPTD
jgi:putative sigma-54 modulation protein